MFASIIPWKSNLNEQKKILASAFWVGLGTLITRIFGLLREIGMAALFGTGVAADAFVVALRFPALLRLLVGEGAFSAAFLPKFAEVTHKEGKEAGFRMASAVLAALLFLLIFLCALGFVFAPQIIKVIVIGWHDDPVRQALAVKLVRILFGFVAFIGLASYCQAILNYYRKFFVSSVAPALMNLGWLIGVGVAAYAFSTEESRITTVAFFVVFGTFLQFAWQLPWLVKIGWRLKPTIRERTRDLAEIGILLLPSLLALATSELYYLSDVILASFLPGGSVSSLGYGMKLLLLPLGLIGYSIATASLPKLSDLAAQNRRDELAETLSYTARSIFTLLMPIGFAAITLRYEVVRLLFERGSFDAASSTPMVVTALQFYMVGLPFWGLQRAITQGYYAIKDTRTPVFLTAIGVIINIELNAILMADLVHGGIALGSSIGAFAITVMLFYSLKPKLPELRVSPIVVNMVKVIVASAFAAAGTWLINMQLGPVLDTGVRFLTRLLQLIVPSIVFFALFLVFSKLLKIREVKSAYRSLIGSVKRRFT
ncbi:murein biosynthesis integral membrane protein MurJ [bacterium]|nr:MAG: murein biosynthesis integral membrane protein MurJ [bacterium]